VLCASVVRIDQVIFKTESQRSKAATKLAEVAMLVPQRRSVWVADIKNGWPDPIHRQPTRYRVVVLTSLPLSLEKLCYKNKNPRTCYKEFTAETRGSTDLG
jgi:hypothetical protein